MGSAVWTASAVNIAHWVTHSTDPAVANHVMGTVLVIYGVAVAFLAMLLTQRIDWTRFVRNILFVVPFSYLVQWFVPLFRDFLRIGELQANFSHPYQLALDIIIDIFGLFWVATAVS